jgi:hypothetical protein
MAPFSLGRKFKPGAPLTWVEQVLSARGFKRVEWPSEHAIYTVWGFKEEAHGVQVNPPNPHLLLPAADRARRVLRPERGGPRGEVPGRLADAWQRHGGLRRHERARRLRAPLRAANGAPAIAHLAGADGTGAACPAGSKPLMGAPGTAGGRYDFDPRGGGATLCVTATGAATAGRR